MEVVGMATQPFGDNIATPRKRNHEGALISFQYETVPNTSETTTGTGTSRSGSPAPSDTGSELTELTSTDAASPNSRGVAARLAMDISDGSTPMKKRKLTFAERQVEKAVKQREKEDKAKQKLEEKARKEDEKRQRDEEKRKKEEEREAAQRVKDVEKAEKDKLRDVKKLEKEAEKAKKEAEKKDRELEILRKERSQLRIGAFFGRPAPQSTPPITPDELLMEPTSRRSSIGPIDMPESVVKLSLCEPSNPDFEKYIIPYFVHEHTELAPTNRFAISRMKSDPERKQELDLLCEQRHSAPLLHTVFTTRKRRMKNIRPVKEIVDQINAVQMDPTTMSDTGRYLLRSIPYKMLRFREDIRPPFTGTYTKRVEPAIARKMSRRPMYRGRTDTNYDYDSEAEWEEPAADDEEILDDEMSESEDGDEEMQDFLDDEDDHGRRRLYAGAMEPVSSGICFEGLEYESNGYNMEEYRMDVLHDSTTLPIDPHSTVHWCETKRSMDQEITLSRTQLAPELAKIEPAQSIMPPPRVPLAPVSTPNNLNGFLSPGHTIVVSQNENASMQSKQRGRLAVNNKELKMIAPEFMAAFKSAVSGSDLTKAGLIEVLKKQFPKCSKDAIKDTLGVIAARVGKKEAEKKWALI